MEKSCSITKGQMLAGARVGTISLVLGRHHVAKQRKDGAKRSLLEKRITKEVQEQAEPTRFQIRPGYIDEQDTFTEQLSGMMC